MTYAGIDGTLMNKESWFDCNLALVDVKKMKNKTMALSEPVDLPIPQYNKQFKTSIILSCGKYRKIMLCCLCFSFPSATICFV
jgi:tRNA G37 N-methylase TrmD